MKRPLIGITTYHITPQQWNTPPIVGVQGQEIVASSIDYSGLIHSGGGTPVLIPTLDDPQYIEEITREIDGLLLSGGEDIDPLFLQTAPSPYIGRTDIKRDQFEFHLFNQFFKTGKPILGICRGCQLIHVALGGTLYQDYREFDESLSYHCEQPYQSLVHTVHLKETLKQCYQKDQLIVNSHHHQFLKDIPPSLEITAEAPDGIVEAIAHKTHPFCHAVQWHPEMIYQIDPIQKRLVSWLIQHC